MARAVHWLHRQHAFVAALGDEHVLAEILPVAGRLPQATVEQKRPLDLVIAGGVEAAAHVAFDGAVERPALGVPEDAADRLLAEMEQAEVAAELAMVAAFGLR